MTHVRHNHVSDAEWMHRLTGIVAPPPPRFAGLSYTDDSAMCEGYQGTDDQQWCTWSASTSQCSSDYCVETGDACPFVYFPGDGCYWDGTACVTDWCSGYGDEFTCVAAYSVAYPAMCSWDGWACYTA